MQGLTKEQEYDALDAVAAEEVAASGPFARGVNGYKLFWIFLITAFLGALTETIFMLLTRGELQNRSGVLYGQFSLVWGVGAALFTLLFQRLSRSGNIRIFLCGTLAGAGYEYVCSWLQEILFGARFWNYSHLPFNLNGRVNLVFSLFWGIAALLWVRALYPLESRWIGKLPRRAGKTLTLVLAALMVLNVTVSGAALARMDARHQGNSGDTAVERFLDSHYSDAALKRHFSSLVYIGTAPQPDSAGEK